jgi:hypothetical protein
VESTVGSGVFPSEGQSRNARFTLLRIVVFWAAVQSSRKLTALKTFVCSRNGSIRVFIP